MITNVLRAFVALFLIFPVAGLGCCSSPLAEIVFVGKVVSVESVEKDGETIYQLHIENSESVLGSAPENFIAEINELTLKEVYKTLIKPDASYLITLFDKGKHNKDRLLSSNKWAEQDLALHSIIGFLNPDSFRARMVKKNIAYHGHLEWSKDFKFMNIFFIQN